MAKTKVSEWSAIPANNTDVGGIDINEGCAPSGINNAIRDVMAQIKDMQTGADGDNFVVGGNLTVNGTITLATDLPVAQGGTGASSAADARTNLGLGSIATQASSSVTITGGSITGITDLTVADGGTGASSITANSVILGNGSSALSGNLVAPSTSGNVLTSNGTTWTSATPAGGLGVGQTWQDLSASRLLSTSYTNSTGKPIQVSVGTSGNSAAFIQAVVGGVTITGSDNCGTFGGRMYISFIVPNGVSYTVSLSAGSPHSTFNWVELR
jgi:hypothetical protein